MLSRFLKGAAIAHTEIERVQRLLPVLRHVEGHLGEPLRNEDLARLLHICPKYFCNLFSSLVGIPPAAYVNRQRVLRAKERLLLSAESIKTIAHEVGFAEPFHFSRVFRNIKGLSPRRYRERYLRSTPAMTAQP